MVSNQFSTVFTAPSATLGLGLHPFYALVTDTDENQYRTETVLIRMVPAFMLRIGGSPLTLSWAAIPSQRYDVLATTNLASGFEPVASITASNALAEWPVLAPGGAAAFYRVQLSCTSPTAASVVRGSLTRGKVIAEKESSARPIALPPMLS